jgi:hypothetical protein
MIFPDFSDRRNVSWDEEGDNIELLNPLLLCNVAVSVGSGASSRYFSVVEGTMVIILLSRPLLLLFALFSIDRLLDCVSVTMVAPSSESLSC